MRVLVIGSEGNIGKELTKYLRKCNHEIVECDIKPGWKEGYYQVDINIPIDMVKIFMDFKPEVVYLLSAMVSRVTCEISSGLATQTNISSINNVCELCKLFDSKLIYFSTSEVYGNTTEIMDEDLVTPCPNNRYGLTKYLGEKIVEYEVTTNSLKAVSVRPFMIYHEDETHGDHRSSMIRFVEHLIKREQIEIHVGSERAWLHLDDAVKAFEKAMYLDRYEVINIGSDEYVKTEDLARYIANEIGVDLKDYAKFIDLPSRMTLVKRPSLRKMHELLGVKSTISIQEGIKRVVAGFRK